MAVLARAVFEARAFVWRARSLHDHSQRYASAMRVLALSQHGHVLCAYSKTNFHSSSVLKRLCRLPLPSPSTLYACVT